MAEETDYEKILSDLQEERANLDRMIAWVKGRLAKTDPAEPTTVDSLIQKSISQPMRFPRTLKPDTFFKMSVQQAMRECLSLLKKPLSARDITNYLKSGGFTHKAKNLYQTVFPTLMRMKEKGEVDRLANGEWGLSEWYSGARRAEPESGKREPE
jgi:hypothetical protein